MGGAGAVDQGASVGGMSPIGIAGDADIVRLRAQSVDLQCVGLVTSPKRDHARAFVGGRVVAKFCATAAGLTCRGGWDAIINHIDDAAHG